MNPGIASISSNCIDVYNIALFFMLTNGLCTFIIPFSCWSFLTKKFLDKKIALINFLSSCSALLWLFLVCAAD